MLSLPCRDKELRRLASSLNEELRLLRKERLRYQQGDRELKEAVVNVSHAAHAPDRPLRLCGAAKRRALSPAGQRYLSQIEDRAQAMQAMTEELFRYSLAAEETALTLEPVDLRAAVEEALLSFYGAFSKRAWSPSCPAPGPGRSAGLVIGVLVAFSLLFVGQYLVQGLAQPELTREHEPVLQNGVVVGYASSPDAPMVPNPRYVGGALRTVYTFLLHFMPMGQCFLVSFLGLEEPWKLMVGAALFTALAAAAGLILFQKKDVK